MHRKGSFDPLSDHTWEQITLHIDFDIDNSRCLSFHQLQPGDIQPFYRQEYMPGHLSLVHVH